MLAGISGYQWPSICKYFITFKIIMLAIFSYEAVANYFQQSLSLMHHGLISLYIEILNFMFTNTTIPLANISIHQV